jgi:hypothetical protein
MDDVDLLLPPEQHAGALRVLADAGWQRRTVAGRRHHEVVLTHDAVPGLPLELHRALSTWIRRANRLSADELWQQRQSITVGGAPAYGFAPEDELVTLAAHAGKPFHIFDRLIWVTDLAVVVAAADAAGQPLDWDRIAALTARARCGTAVGVALTLAARLGVESPRELRRLPAKGARLAALAPLLSPDWPVTRRDEGIRNRLRYALVDDARLRLALLAENVVGSGPADTARKAASTGVSLVRRWLQLRRSAQGRREQVGKAVEP